MTDLPTENKESEGGLFGHLRLPKILIIAIIAGLAVRLVLMPLLAYEYDNYYWALIVENINSGNGLYEIKGMYYTPVWGYILGFYDIFWSYVSFTGELGIRASELLGIELLEYSYHTATIASPSFIIGLKIILTISDVLVGYLLYKLVLDITNDRKRAGLAFALWFLCPIVMYMSSTQVMFDSISALFLLLSMILLRKDCNLLSGIMLGLACFLKTFPAICIPIFIGYLAVKHKEDIRTMSMKICSLIAGGLISIIAVLIPNIIEGNVGKTFLFLTTRLFNSNGPSILFYLLLIAAILFSALIIWLMFYIGQSQIDEKLNKILLCSLVLTVIATMNPGPQYCIVFIPLLILEIVTKDRGYMICWWLIGIAAAFKAVVMNNFGLLCMAAEYYHLVPYDWVISMTASMDTNIGGMTLLKLLNTIGDVIFDIGIILTLIFCIKPFIDKHWPKIGSVIEKIKNSTGGRSNE